MTTESQPATAPALLNVQMVIGGQQVDAADGQTFDVMNPATGEVIAKAPLGGPEDVNRAVAAAQAAFDDPKGWSSWSAAKRGRTLQKLSGLVKQHLEELARLESRNVGKPISGARGEALAVEPRLRVLRRGRQQALRRDDPRFEARARLHAPRADRRGAG